MTDQITPPAPNQSATAMPPNPIWTSKGWMDEALLVKTVGGFENENECTTWQEWRLGDEIVKRAAQINLKTSVAALGAVNGFGPSQQG